MHHDTTISNDNRIGDLLLAAGMITEENLRIGLKHQGHCGERIGSVLLQLGYLSTETLLEFLSKRFGTASINLFNINISPAILNTLTLEQMKMLQALPIIPSTKGLFVGMADPNDIKVINELEFILGRKVETVAVAHAQLDAVFRYLEKRGGQLATMLSGKDVELEQSGSVMPEGIELKDLFTALMERKASDLLISAGVPPCLKIDNKLVRLPGHDLSPGDLERCAQELMTEQQWQEFLEKGALDFGLSNPTVGRFRINAYRQRGSISLSIRNVVENIPTLADCGLPDWIEEYVMRPQGLILITGPTGHGKSTTLASLLDVINTKRKCNIITIEDPIEFLHKHKMSNINQREVGRDTPSFHDGLTHIFRQAPDVIMIGEMRDLNSFEIAVQAAETGHLVISTMHANTTTTAIERIIEIFPPEKQQQIRVQLAEVFLLILNQRLLPKKNGAGRVLAYEKLANSTRIRNMIRESKTHHIRSMFHHSAAEEYQPMDISLGNLFRSGKITLEEGIKYSENPLAIKEKP